MSHSKVAVISDVHANYQALQAVLAHADNQGVTDVWFLGDAVGYGPDPHRCLELLTKNVSHPNTCWVLGNHDKALCYPPNSVPTIVSSDMNNHVHMPIQLDPLRQHIGINPDNLTAFSINYEILEVYPGQRKFLLDRPEKSHTHRNYFLVHGGNRENTPTTTYIWDHINVCEEFLLSVYKITGQVLSDLKSAGLPGIILKQLAVLCNREIEGEHEFLTRLRQVVTGELTEEHRKIIQDKVFLVKQEKRENDPDLNIFFSGHTHKPACFRGSNNTEKITFKEQDLKTAQVMALNGKQVWFLNPGSVGQPRDGDPRASYMVLDTDERTIRLHRVEYNIQAVQKQMARLAMPENLISRLSRGQ